MADRAHRIEQLAQACIAARAAEDRRAAERGFARLLACLLPRIDSFARSYGLGAQMDDARQCCAIAVHRALGSYEPERARFTTHVTWQMRAELKALRQAERRGRLFGNDRSMADDRESDARIESIPDAAALTNVERVAGDALVEKVLERLRQLSMRESDEAELVRAHLFDAPAPLRYARLDREQRRQIVRRNLRHYAGAVRKGGFGISKSASPSAILLFGRPA